ncbi:hypothetical protein K9N68_33345 [Kovacikia minuta CCNUW1]|uniref:hypothetical protein n=1 Tax=Kovacikia minuta TaxID=2931930 RepID=UPI001CCD752B|nr:hypothetical protein [Kovacikia minuta]UBF26331.1 hypothetical protein K9N68_33345 [Kovacikia minuta CCNUW1]
MNSEQQPHRQDLVLGGEQPPPTAGAVLGGIAGLNQRFEQGDVTQKLATLVQAAKHNDGLNLLYRALEHEDLLIRAEAYVQLKAIASASFVPASFVSSPTLNRGIPLRVSDRIYAVYRSSVYYGDYLYYINAEIDEWYHKDYPFYHTRNTAGDKFIYVSETTQTRYEAPSLIAYLFDRKAADARAKTVYLEGFGQFNCNICEICPDDESEESDLNDEPEEFDLNAWVATNEIFVEDVLKDWEDSDWTYQARVLISLHNQKRFDLLCEIWQPLRYHPLAFVHEYVIDRPCYLRLAALES